MHVSASPRSFERVTTKPKTKPGIRDSLCSFLALQAQNRMGADRNHMLPVRAEWRRGYLSFHSQLTNVVPLATMVWAEGFQC